MHFLAMRRQAPAPIILFTDYEAFASLAAVMLLEHGSPQ